MEGKILSTLAGDVIIGKFLLSERGLTLDAFALPTTQDSVCFGGFNSIGGD